MTGFKISKNITNDRVAIGRLAGILGILGNAFLCIIKFVAGILTHSVSITADAVNSLSDALSGIITSVCFRISGKPADKDHPYGHERIEYVATLILAFFILMVGFELAKSSFLRIVNPVRIPVRLVSVIILVLSVIVKLCMNAMYRGFYFATNSAVLKANARDSLCDAFSTGTVLLAMILSSIFDVALDGYAGLVVSVFILWSGVSLVRETIDTLLGTPPQKEFTDDIEKRILAYDGVIGIHDLIVHSYGHSKTFVSVHAEVDAKGDMLESHDIIDNIERELSQKMGISLVIHMDPIATDDEFVFTTRDEVEKIISDIDTDLTIHDFRMVTGSSHINLIFDVVLPFEFRYKDEEVYELIQNEVSHRLGREYFCIVNFDRSYSG